MEVLCALQIKMRQQDEKILLTAKVCVTLLRYIIGGYCWAVEQLVTIDESASSVQMNNEGERLVGASEKLYTCRGASIVSWSNKFCATSTNRVLHDLSLLQMIDWRIALALDASLMIKRFTCLPRQGRSSRCMNLVGTTRQKFVLVESMIALERFPPRQFNSSASERFQVQVSLYLLGRSIWKW